MSSQPSPNFAYLAHHDARLVALATQAEAVFASDPPTSIAKLRLFAEVLAKRAAAKVGLLPLPNETQQTLVDRLFDKNVIGATQRTIFHDLRRAGNAAVLRRILFLVDRSALGEQTANALKDLRLESLQTFTDIVEVKELADLKPNRETKLHGGRPPGIASTPHLVDQSRHSMGTDT